MPWTRISHQGQHSHPQTGLGHLSAMEWPPSATPATRTWLLLFVATFALSVALGWFLPDGLNQLAGLTGQDPVPDTSLTRFFCFALLFLVAASTEVLVWLRVQANNAVDRIEATVAKGLSDGILDAAESTVLRALLPTFSSPENASMAAHQL